MCFTTFSKYGLLIYNTFGGKMVTYYILLKFKVSAERGSLDPALNMYTFSIQTNVSDRVPIII